MRTLNVYSDGGSRGNPGPSACAFVVQEGDTVVYSESSYLGTSTNNRAEYQGVTNALTWIFFNAPEADVVFHLDSELVVKQLNKEYKVKDLELKKMAEQLWSRAKQLKGKYVFKHVRRDKNKLADKLLNDELDRNAS